MKKQTKRNHDWMLPGWSWRKELAEVMKCLLAAIVVAGTLAVPTKLLYNAYFVSDGHGIGDPSQSVIYQGTADVGGGVTTETVYYGQKDPSQSTARRYSKPAYNNEVDGSGQKDSSYESATKEEPIETDYSREEQEETNTPTAETLVKTSAKPVSDNALSKYEPPVDTTGDSVTHSNPYNDGRGGWGDDPDDFSLYDDVFDDGTTSKPVP